MSQSEAAIGIARHPGNQSTLVRQNADTHPPNGKQARNFSRHNIFLCNNLSHRNDEIDRIAKNLVRCLLY
jgi:hypothetical protein